MRFDDHTVFGLVLAVLLAPTPGCSSPDMGNGLWFASAHAWVEYLELHGEQQFYDGEIVGNAGYWMEDGGLYMIMIDRDASFESRMSIEYQLYATSPPSFRIGAGAFGILSDCAVFWPEGAIHETMNVVDGILFAHLTIDTSGVPAETPPECGPGLSVRFGIEGTRPLTYSAHPNLTFE